MQISKALEIVKKKKFWVSKRETMSTVKKDQIYFGLWEWSYWGIVNKATSKGLNKLISLHNSQIIVLYEPKSDRSEMKK